MEKKANETRNNEQSGNQSEHNKGKNPKDQNKKEDTNPNNPVANINEGDKKNKIEAKGNSSSQTNSRVRDSKEK